jgi:hypothetical protein
MSSRPDPSGILLIFSASILVSLTTNASAAVDLVDPPGIPEDIMSVRQLEDQYAWYDFSSTKGER